MIVTDDENSNVKVIGRRGSGASGSSYKIH